MNADERLVDIELKLTAVEDLAQSLSEQVYRQQKQIDELSALCKLLARRAFDSEGGTPAVVDERPPHY